MTNSEALRNKIRDSGVSITWLAAQLGISRECLHSKLKNNSEFKASEIALLSKLLPITKKERDQIFFAGKVN